MTTRLQWSRRAFVAAASQMGVLQLIGSSGIAKASGRENDAKETELLYTACDQLSCTGVLSGACREALGVTAPFVKPLALELLQRLRSLGYDCSSVTAALTSLREQSRRDFAAGKIIYVDHWILSETETQAYAIIP